MPAVLQVSPRSGWQPASNKAIMKFALSRSALIALALESLIIAVFAVVLERQPVKEKPKQPVVMLTFPALPDPPKPQTPPKQEKPVSRPRPVHHQQPRPDPVQQPKIADAAPSTIQAPASPPAPPKVESPAPAPDIAASFRSAVRASVQAAVHYPYAARMAHVSGKALVSFSYHDGTVSNPSIVTSSGYSLLDNAAKQAVETASYPPPPPELAGRALQFQVWVRFNQNQVQ